MESTIDTVIRVARFSMGLDHNPSAGHSVEDAGGDSIDLVEFIGDLEDEFKVEIDGGEVTVDMTFSDVAAVIDAKMTA